MVNLISISITMGGLRYKTFGLSEKLNKNLR